MKKLVPLMIVALSMTFIVGSAAQCDSNDLLLKMYDTYGDGWTNNQLTIYSLNSDCGKVVAAGPFELSLGTYGTEDLCLPDGCYSIRTTAGKFVHEISWELVRKSDNALLSSGQNVDNVYLLPIGDNADCGFIGCTDSSAENYNANATCSFSTCIYTAPVNDEACGAITLDCGVSGIYGTTEGATDSGVNACKGYGVEDLWYTMIGTGNTMKVTVKGLADTTNMQITVLVSFDGGCDGSMVCNSLTSFVKEAVNTKTAWWDSDAGATYYINIGSKNLTPNSEYNLSTECLGCDNGVTLNEEYVGTKRAQVSWTSMTSELSQEKVWICPQGISVGSSSCTEYLNATSPMTFNDLNACTDYDIYLEQTCTNNEVVTTGPLAIATEEHTVDLDPNVGQKVCYPPCHDGVTSYASNEEITWTLCTEEGMSPAVTFDYVDIESDAACTTDKLEVNGEGYTISLCGESQGDADFGNGLADGNCYFANQNGGCITIKFASNGSIEESGFCFDFHQIPMAEDTDCVDFEAATSSVPVNLVAFNATALKDYNLISWVTASEINNQYQIVEFSNDGISWDKLDQIRSQGGSDKNSYTVRDYTPSLITFYRLMTIDYDGYVEIFDPVVLQRDKDLTTLAISSVVPNPAQDVVTISLASANDDNMELYIVDMSGKVLHQLKWNADNSGLSMNINIEEIPSGVYFLNLKSNNDVVTKKLIISK